MGVHWGALDFALVDFQELALLDVVGVLRRKLLRHLLHLVLAGILMRRHELLLLVGEQLEDGLLAFLLFVCPRSFLVAVAIPVDFFHA